MTGQHARFGQTGRNSGIELLKIFAIFLIVVSHVTQTLDEANAMIGYQDYVIYLGYATHDLQSILLMLQQQTGRLGNNIFFICSAYFLVGRQGNARKKAFSMLGTVWALSVLILCLYLLICPSCLKGDDVIRQLLPTCYGNNWYITCYILFLFVYPWLNRLIALADRRQLLRITLFSCTLWIVLDYFMNEWFFPSTLLLWCAVYFLMAYLKLYCGRVMESARTGCVLVAIGVLGYVAQVMVTNWAGLYWNGAYSDKLFYWNTNSSPYYIMMSVGLFILALRARYRVRLINYVSGLSLFVYLIHENYLLRNYARTAVWQYLYTHVGYTHVVLLDLAFSAVLFLTAVLVSAAYRETLQRLVTAALDRLYPYAAKAYGCLERALLKEK